MSSKRYNNKTKMTNFLRLLFLFTVANKKCNLIVYNYDDDYIFVHKIFKIFHLLLNDTHPLGFITYVAFMALIASI